MEVKISKIDTKEIDALIAAAENKNKLLRTIGMCFVNIIGESFEKEQSPDGKPWKPVAETKELAKHRLSAWRKGKQFKKKILHDSGLLSESFSAKIKSGGLIVGTNLEYAAIHQFGGKAGRRKKVTIDARPFLPVTGDKLLKSTEEEIYKIIEEHLTQEK
jgi:phage virion morphogenesis protein